MDGNLAMANHIVYQTEEQANTPICGHQFDQPARKANRVNSDLQDYLLEAIENEIVKVGDPVYKVLSNAIEELNNIAYHEKEEFERKND